ncbi:MAG: methylated-DNA--[protein]-cysteine S-methyltransferase [Gammaproteobacteria bacterium]|nr:methylated-DNA--[protein]-cysteine S-methyltransferase [Gammaproteobacteria bacterium]
MNLTFESPVGQLSIQHNGKAITALQFEEQCVNAPYNPEPKDRFSKTLFAHLTAYFQGTPKRTIPPLLPTGTPFQKKVWLCLTQIKMGETITYGRLALELHTHPRAIASACRSNPIVIFIPCHRVVAQKGCGGFMGSPTGHPVKIKAWLLLHEKTLQGNL